MCNVRPPGVADSWEKCNVDAQSDLIGFWQIREVEEAESTNRTLKGIFG